MAHATSFERFVARPFETFFAIRGGPCDMIDFCEVVIFAGHPENWHGFDATLSEFFDNSQRGKRFVERVCGAAEESHLLTCDDCDGFTGETIQVERNFGWELPAGEAGVLLAKDVDDRRAPFLRVGCGIAR